ncbi:hypothetical protein ACPV5R_20230 [Vibrio astriarenae]
MKIQYVKHSIVALAVTSIIVGCGGGGGGDGGGDSNYKQIKSNTKGATAFAFVTDSASYSDEVSIDAMSTRNGEPSLTTVSGSCDDLVKVTEVEIEDPDSPDSENPEFITEKVFSESDSNNCSINEVVPMSEHLILRGNFYQLADATGKEIHHCLLVALPLDEANGLGECLVYDTPTDYGSYIDGVNVTGDGKGLQIMYHHTPDLDNNPLIYLPTLAYWDNNGKVETLYQQPTEGGASPIHTAWSYDGSEHYFTKNFDGPNSWVNPAHINCSGSSCGGLGIDRDYYAPYHHSHRLHEKFVQSGEFVITNLKGLDNSGEIGSVVLNTKYMMPFSLTEFSLNGVAGSLSVLQRHEIQHQDAENIYFSGDFDVDYGAEGTVYGGFFKVAKADLSTNFIPMEQMFTFSEYSKVYESNVGETNYVFLEGGTGGNMTLSYYDIDSLEHVSDNILERPELVNFDTFEIRQYVSGVKIIASNFFGESAELFFDQVTGEITKDPIDRQEIGGTIPLYPTSGI